MAVTVTKLDGQNTGLRLLGQTSVSVLSLHLTSGEVTSDYLEDEDCLLLKQFALNLFKIVPVSARPASAIGLLNRLCAVSPADASVLTLTASVSTGIATLTASVAASPASLLLTIPFSASGGVMQGMVTTNASNGGGGGGGGDTLLFSSDEALNNGDVVARTPTGKVRRADCTDPDRLPAIGLVTGRNEDGRYIVQVTGIAPAGLYFVGSQPAVYVGEDGRLTSDVSSLTNVQLFGFWVSSTTFVIHVDPRVFVRST